MSLNCQFPLVLPIFQSSRVFFNLHHNLSTSQATDEGSLLWKEPSAKADCHPAIVMLGQLNCGYCDRYGAFLPLLSATARILSLGLSVFTFCLTIYWGFLPRTRGFSQDSLWKRRRFHWKFHCRYLQDTEQDAGDVEVHDPSQSTGHVNV